MSRSIKSVLDPGPLPQILAGNAARDAPFKKKKQQQSSNIAATKTEKSKKKALRHTGRGNHRRWPGRDTSVKLISEESKFWKVASAVFKEETNTSWSGHLEMKHIFLPK